MVQTWCKSPLTYLTFSLISWFSAHRLLDLMMLLVDGQVILEGLDYL